MADDEEMAAAAAQHKLQRKPKRRTMDAHFWGMSDAEIAAIKASLAAEAGDDGGSDGGNKDAPESSSKQADDEQEQRQEHAEEPYAGQLSSGEIQQRRRILHADWRMAAFSQFAHCFPHLCIKDFSIEKLERDLEGTAPGTYVGEVISRLLYHLTKDSALAGKSPDKPWLIRLRREFLRRDPTHNSLGDWPLFVSGGDFYDEEEEEQAATIPAQTENDTPRTGAGTPTVDQSAAPVGPPLSAAASAPQPADSGTAVKSENGGTIGDITMDTSETHQLVKEERDEDEKPAWLAEFPNSKGWEDLTLQEQIYALWSVTEWHLTNADKFRNILVKYRIEPENPFWRVEPIGYDKDYNVYWMFDDFRLWIERQTPVRRRHLVLLEETAERLKARERARQKRIRHEQRMRMKALHDRRRERMAAKRAAEEALDQEIEAMDEVDRIKAQEASANGRTSGKRKRAAIQDAEEDDADADFAIDEEEETQSTRVSSRLSRAKKAEPATDPSSRRSRRRSTRNSSVGNLAGLQRDVNGEEEWQKIPAEWMRSEEEERDEDPDFGAEQQENGAESENDSELSNLEDEGDNVKATRKSGRRASQRSRRTSPRKPRESRVKSDTKNESELSDLSDVEMSLDEAEDAEEPEEGEEKIDLNEPVGHYPDSAWETYNSMPGFDDEDKDQPEGFVHWELIIKDIHEWLNFTETFFPNAQDSREIALVSWVEEQVVPKVHAELERREEVRKKEEAARKAAERKTRIDKEKAAAAAGTSPAPGTAPAGRSFRSSRIAQKEAKEAEERAKALAEERLHKREGPDQSVPHAEGTPESQAQAKIAERDRRAARAKEREEAKKAKEEAELMAALAESGGGPAESQAALSSQPVADMHMEASVKAAEAVLPPQSHLPVQASQAGSPPMSIPVQLSGVPPPPVAVPEAPVAETEPEVFHDGAEDYFLDCSVCKKRGLNLDPNSRLVACDNCDRWEHVVCHRKADERASRPKRDWENDPFLCEDCEGLEESIIVPSAPKRERSEKQKAGAKKGAEKRKAKAAAERAKKAASNPKPKPAKPVTATAVTSTGPNATKNSANPASPRSGSQGQPAPTHGVHGQGQVAYGMQPPQQGQIPAVQMHPQASTSYQQAPQPTRSPYQQGAPALQSSFANVSSPSLQPHHQQYASQPYQQGQPQIYQQGMQPRQVQQGLPSPQNVPHQQPQIPQYAMQQQHAFQGNAVAGYQGNPGSQSTFTGGPPPQMYGQQAGLMPGANALQHSQQQARNTQGGYMSGYPALPPQQMAPGNLVVHPQPHQTHPPYIQQPGGVGMGGQFMPGSAQQRPAS